MYRLLIIATITILCASSLDAQINIATNFGVNTAQPIDLRDTLTFIADTANVSNKFSGLLTYVRETDSYFRVDSSLQWQPFGGSGSSQSTSYVAYDAALTFTSSKYYTPHTASTDITFTADTTNQALGSYTIARVDFDTGHPLNFSGSAFDTTQFYSVTSPDTLTGVHMIYFESTPYGVAVSVPTNADNSAVVVDNVAPVLSSAVVSNGNPALIILSYNENLDESSIPATTDFSVSGGKTVSSVSISGTQVSITVNSNYAYSDVITVSYTSGTNKIEDTANNAAPNLSSQPVTNNINAPVDLATELGSKLLVWLKDGRDAANVVESGTVSQWTDASSNSNHFTQGTSGNQPTRSATTGVVFDGVNDMLTLALSLDSFELHFLIRSDTITENARVFDTAGSGRFMVQQRTTGGDQLRVFSYVNSNIASHLETTTDFNSYSFISNSATSQLIREGASEPIDAGAISITNLYFGARSTLDFAGGISALSVVITEPLTTQERQNVTDYFDEIKNSL